MGYIFETNLNRSMALGLSYGYMIISPCRQLKKSNPTQAQIDKQNQENNRSMEMLKYAVSSMGLSYVQVRGGYREEGASAFTEEASLFIVNWLYKEKEPMEMEDFIVLALDLAREFNQDSVLIYDPVYGSPAYYDKYGQRGMVFRGFKVNDLEADYYTSFNKGGRFTYENKHRSKKMGKLTEKRIDAETKIQALAEYLGVDPSIIEESYDNNFSVDNGTEGEYMVLTEDESYKEFYDWEEGLWDDLGMELFTDSFQNYIMENCLDEAWADEFAEEEADYYISEMSDEDLLDYAHVHRLARDVEDTDSEDFDRTDLEDMCKQEYAEEITDRGIGDYLKELFGRNWARENKDMLSKAIDFDKVVEALYDIDDRDAIWGQMSAWDGKLIELGKYNGEELYAYRTN